MYVHLGGNVVVPDNEIIAVFNIDIKHMSKDTCEFLRIAEEEGFIVKISKDNLKSFVVTERDNKSIIYLSPISSYTIIKRALKYEE
ncbi:MULTISPECIES: extracellular matrix regulator RemB [Thermoanaerobacterium]|jgi:extracellular matrix regulatory protein B|uniref:DUF370 domain-containing protein n=1 Tax=Thermoanaerobacterium butyriciformans TaxID=1702242 RepID=A0ABS4NEM2_9THEO|nr:MULTISPECIES: extracellular matrix/biofilm biosynthesis regulator RemA family protein [Thermoanaerobacterium]MBE0069201.1 DUF370 domain-containing protein [Thermoanaerobacterium thermosaccharolyticum]MBE0229024.1 DUF370 domain-containing protein [Thermoanaerobacterium thermosaccharolyticum]MBP2072119.1 hypothetical protein [Thermoanaerobacterium butyriciformans]WHE07206.1 DUF370 domain-containing protein [Thermoanaerobacterium thermosaccharolyticum]